MKYYTNLKKSNKVGLIVSLVLIVLGISGCVAGLIKSLSVSQKVSVHIVLNLVMYIPIMIYALFGYKKPHGNMLRYTFLIFGVLIVLQNVIPNGPIANVTIHSIVCGCSGIFAMLVAYIAGRLDKIEKNVLLMIIALVLIIVCSVLLIISYDNFNFMRSLSHLTQPICFSSLCFAYTSRYDEHKLVGLE